MRDEGASVIERLAMLLKRERAAFLRGVSDADIALIFESWCFWARRAQLPPPFHWTIWLILAGRGFGKTRSGAEWVHHMAMGKPNRIAMVGATDDEVRRVMIEGSSGIMNCTPVDERPSWEPSLGVLRWPSGTQAFVYSGAKADGLRGPEHDYAWCDEIAKWAQPEAAFDNLRMGLRRGRWAQMLVTTTPRPTPLMRRLLATPGIAVTTGRTRDNAHLAQGFLDGIERDYGGTRLGRQELDGVMLDEFEGALWTRAMIEASRVGAAAAFCRVVIGVDPPASAHGDACGIVCVGLGVDGVAYVIEDASIGGLSPEGWAGAVVDVSARHGADRVIAEANNGGAMVESVLRAADTGLPVKLVHASRGKVARAEPVAALYGRGRVRHVGAFPQLEDELCGLIVGGEYEGPGRSPDRADALVWAVNELMLGTRKPVLQIRAL